MSTLNNGFTIGTQLGGKLTVKKFIAEGKQGEVYLVDYNGTTEALKWYKKVRLGTSPTAFYENMRRNVQKGTPSSEFLWPIDVTDWHGETFGYVMHLRPANFYEVTDYMLCRQRFSSYKAAIAAALHIVSAFRILHNAGYSYQDINDGKFFINPADGNVLICDTDNIAPDGTETGIIGKPRYMAPEIVLRKAKPDSLSDSFSMSVILYILFCLNHPLEGKRYFAAPCLTTEIQEKIYGSEPLFMMDPNDNSNAPHPRMNINSINVWKCLPDYMQKLFLDAFSQTALHNPSARPKEIDWLKALTRFRSEVVKCSCGNEVFTKQGRPCRCDECGRSISIPFRLELGEYSIPAVRDARIYRCQLGVCNEKEALDPVAHILAKKDNPAVLGVMNKSGKTWNAVTSKGTPRDVKPGEVIPLKDGITFKVFNAQTAIKAN